MKARLSGIASRLTFSNVVAVIALFIALGGASYAAVNLPKNSVGTKQIKKNAVNSKKVKNRSLLAMDFKRGQLPGGAVGPTGPAGSAGSAGQTGSAGPAGQDGATGEDGATGTEGATGLQGPFGPQGPTGFTGVAGETGPTGDTGAAGIAGTSSAAVMSAHTQSYLTGYFAISGVTSTTAATKGDVVSISPAVPVTARNLAVRVPDNFSPGSSFNVQLQDDGVSVLACTATFVNFSTPSTCQNTSDSPVISPGSELVLLGINNNFGPAKVDVGFTLGP